MKGSSGKLRFRCPYECDFVDSSDDFVCVTDSLTNQSERDSVDIRQIIERYRSNGVIPEVSSAEAVFADVSDVHDYAEMMRRVSAGREYFQKLPADVREQFANDPVQFMDRVREAEESLLNGQDGQSAATATATVPVPDSGDDKQSEQSGNSSD